MYSLRCESYVVALGHKQVRSSVADFFCRGLKTKGALRTMNAAHQLGCQSLLKDSKLIRACAGQMAGFFTSCLAGTHCIKVSVAW